MTHGRDNKRKSLNIGLVESVYKNKWATKLKYEQLNNKQLRDLNVSKE